MRLLFVLLSIAPSVLGACQRQCVRKEIHDFSDNEWTVYTNAILKLATPTNGVSKYDTYASTHISNSQFAHGSSQFLAWHRQFLIQFELDLQAIDPSICVPFWDWSRESQAPQDSIIWSKLGRSRGRSNCINDGLLTGLRFSSSLVQSPRLRGGYCTTRDFTRFILPSSEMLLQLMVDAGGDFSTFVTTLELTHGNLHVQVGSEMGTFNSPTDPLFWQHHAFIDKVWTDYQSTLTASNSPQYNGINPEGNAASLNDVMIPFNLPVNAVIQVSELCYTYARGNGGASSPSAPTIPGDRQPQIANSPNTPSSPTVLPNIPVPTDNVPPQFGGNQAPMPDINTNQPNQPSSRFDDQGNFDIVFANFFRSFTPMGRFGSRLQDTPTSFPVKKQEVPEPLPMAWFQANFNHGDKNAPLPPKVLEAKDRVAFLFNETQQKLSQGIPLSLPVFTNANKPTVDDGKAKNGAQLYSLGLSLLVSAFIVVCL